MANLRGEITSDNGRTTASRLAHHEIAVSANTWDGEIRVWLTEDGTFEIDVRPLGTHNGRVIAKGNIKDALTGSITV